MIELSRGLSFVSYRYEGGALRFIVTFPYLAAAHVRAFVAQEGEETKRQVSYKWVDSTTIEISDQSDALSAPYVVTLSRTTPISELVVKFRDGANLPARDLVKALSQLLFALQEATELGTAFSGGAGGSGGSGGGYTDINEIINEVIRSPAYQALQEKIPLLDRNAELIIGELLRSNDFFDSARIHSDRLNKAETRIGLTESATEVLAEQSTELHANLDTLTTQTTAQYNELNQALATEKDARSVAVRDLYSQVTSETDGKISTTTATINEQLATKATPEEAEAIASTAVEAFAGGQFSALKQSYEAYVNANDGRWNATWSLQVNGGDPANPVVGGIALGADTNGSSFVIEADRVAIALPGATSGVGAKFPFVVGTVGGVSSVGITGQLLVDGSVSANKITANTLSAITANAGTINGGTFKTLSLDAEGNVINALEFRAEMSNVGDWPVWVGSGEKTENNAVFYVDRNGAAMFKGKVTAPNIVGKFQQYIVCAWSGKINGASPAATSSFVMPPPILAGESHIPMIQLSLTFNNTHSDEYGSVYVSLQRLVGGTWVNVRGPYIVGLNHGENRADALFVADTQTSASETYRIYINTVSGRSENINLLAVDGLIFGLR